MEDLVCWTPGWAGQASWETIILDAESSQRENKKGRY